MARGKQRNKKKTLEILKPYFQRGCSVKRACAYAGIPQQTVDTWINKDEELRLQITCWQNTVNITAREIIAQEILTKKDVAMAQWWIIKTEDEMKDTKNVNLTTTVEEFAKRFDITEE